MQYLKDEVRNSIMEEALKEFRNKGYIGASIRSIAKSSGTSVGNLYKYFYSKDQIYESLIGPVYQNLMSYINHFGEIHMDDKAEDIFYDLMEKVMEIFEENSIELAILLNMSEGSRYEKCKSTFVNFITDTVTEMMQYKLSRQGKRLKDNFIIYLFSYDLVENMAIILREKENGSEVRKLITDVIDIFFKDIIKKLDTEEI